MKTYTLTWIHLPYFGSIRSRCRFEPGCVLWNRRLGSDVVAQFALRLLFMVNPIGVRLSCSGRLVARSATYQGL